MAKPKPENPPVQVPFRCDPELKARLETFAGLKKKSVNAAIVELLDHALGVRGQ